jgi:hypothetical protein
MERCEHRFMVHIWLESADGGDGMWRGAVDHIGSGQRFYFASLGDLTDFIRLRTSERPTAEPTRTVT